MIFTKDTLQSTKHLRSILYLVQLDFKKRYRRSKLGQLWITLSTLIFITLITSLYSNFFEIESEKYVLHLSIGYVLWIYIANSINKASDIFRINRDKMFVYRKNPSFFVMRHLFYEFFCFLHNSIIIVLALIFFGSFDLFFVLLALVSIILLTFTLYQISFFISLIGGRYSDFRELIGSVMTIIFFTAPIWWVKDFDNFFVNLNFAYHLIEIVREPLITSTINIVHLKWTILINLILLILNELIYKRVRDRIIIWPQ